MRIMKNLLFAAAAALLLYGAASAADNNVGTDGAAFLKIPTGSPRAQALGNSGVSIVEGGEAMGINPAGIASAQMREGSYSYLSWLEGYSGHYMSYVHPIGQVVIGANMAYYDINGFDARDSEGIPQDSGGVKANNGYASLSLAKGFFLERLLVGISAKEVMESMSVDNSHSKKYKNLVFDMGAILKLGRKFSVGWANLNASGKSHQVVKAHRFGGAYAFNPFFTLVLEEKSYSDRKWKPSGGVELSLPEEVLQVGRVVLRVGCAPSDNMGKNTADKLFSGLSGFSFGVGIYSAQALGYGMGLDYTMAPYGALGKTSQMSLRFQF